MIPELFADMKRYLAFGDADAKALSDLREPLRPAFPAIVDAFYSAILAHPNARAVLGRDSGRVNRLKASFHKWLVELFSGDYGETYFKSRSRIGHVHVEVDLPQHYMFTAMNVVRLGLIQEVWKLGLKKEHESGLTAIHKILDLELAIMNQAYREDMVRRMQEVERADFQARISESEHLATIGQLAASLAHEIKNPLAGISGAVQVLGAALDPKHPHKEIIAEALRQIDRLDAAVKDLLIFARPKPPDIASHDLGHIIEQALILLREEPALRKVRVHVDGTGRGQVLRVDGAQIQQVITNLLINAAHACERTGEIFCHISRADRGMKLVIEDSGHGIPAHVLAKVFEPFYTTKARGTGLGLSICKRIVESHGGSLHIESAVGKGTRVTVQLPEHS